MKDLEKVEEYTNLKGERLKVLPSGITTSTLIFYPARNRELFLVGDLSDEMTEKLVKLFEAADPDWDNKLKWSEEGGWPLVLFWIFLAFIVVWATWKIAL